MKFKSWSSPYQSQAYWDALSNEDVPYTTLTYEDGNKIFFDLSVDTPTAWEVAHDDEEEYRIPEGYAAYQLCDPAENMHEDSYYTLALTKGDVRFNKRYLRQVKKAYININNPNIQLAETSSQLRAAVSMFDEHPEHRDNLPTEVFRRRITALGGAGVLLAYVLRENEQPLGVSFALRTDAQVNLRYYSAARHMGAGHLLHYMSIEDMFTNQNIEVVDLSGVSPHSSDEKMRGIDEFKNQIGGTLVEFRRSCTDSEAPVTIAQEESDI